MDMTIYLPQSARNDDAGLVEDFYEFITCYVEGHWKQHRQGVETLRRAEIDVYCALRYEGEVNNGGHNQYINNLDNNQDEFEAALAGLKFLSAEAHARVLADMMDWVQENPTEVTRMLNTYHFIKQPALDELDRRFFDIDKSASVRQLAANWLKSHANLKIVSEQEFMTLRKTYSSGAHLQST